MAMAVTTLERLLEELLGEMRGLRADLTQQQHQPTTTAAGEQIREPAPPTEPDAPRPEQVTEPAAPPPRKRTTRKKG